MKNSLVLTALAMTVALAGGSAAHAEDGTWTFDLEPVFAEVFGHDQHVLTIHEIDRDATPRRDSKQAVSLDTDDSFAYRGEIQYTRGQWGLGVDFFWLVTSQGAPALTAAAQGSIDEIGFEVADRTFTSSGPGQVLFYNVLEDTDLELWTLDLYAMRVLAGTPETGLRWLIGLRNGDFDNDYRAVVGIRNVAGSRLDASSNYDRMMGPLVGLAGSFQRGRNSLEGTLRQSVLFGSVELSSSSREFAGPVSETPAVFAQESFRTMQDVAIPISELRIKWSYRLTERIALGAGIHTSAWWDVAVPPGVIPIADGDEALHENTIVVFGVLGAVKITL